MADEVDNWLGIEEDKQFRAPQQETNTMKHSDTHMATDLCPHCLKVANQDMREVLRKLVQPFETDYIAQHSAIADRNRARLLEQIRAALSKVEGE